MVFDSSGNTPEASPNLSQPMASSPPLANLGLSAVGQTDPPVSEPMPMGVVAPNFETAADPPSVSEPQKVFEVNSRVKIKGLKSALHHNGKPGKVISYDSAKGRYLVEIDGEKDAKGNAVQISVLPANIERHVMDSLDPFATFKMPGSKSGSSASLSSSAAAVPPTGVKVSPRRGSGELDPTQPFASSASMTPVKNVAGGNSNLAQAKSAPPPVSAPMVTPAVSGTRSNNPALDPVVPPPSDQSVAAGPGGGVDIKAFQSLMATASEEAIRAMRGHLDELQTAAKSKEAGNEMPRIGPEGEGSQWMDSVLGENHVEDDQAVQQLKDMLDMRTSSLDSSVEVVELPPVQVVAPTAPER